MSHARHQPALKATAGSATGGVGDAITVQGGLRDNAHEIQAKSTAVYSNYGWGVTHVPYMLGGVVGVVLTTVGG